MFLRIYKFHLFFIKKIFKDKINFAFLLYIWKRLINFNNQRFYLFIQTIYMLIYSNILNIFFVYIL